MLPCPTCPHLNGPVPPSGPAPCEVLLIGEAPHKSEDRKRVPFSGPTGQELNRTYLPSAGLTRPEVAVTNAMACSLHRYRNPKPDEARPCADYHLPAQLAHYAPSYVVLMGAVACSLAYPPVDLESDHGIPFIGRLYDWTGVILPLYHPSAGIHDSHMMIQILDDWPILRDVIHGLDSHPIIDTTPTDYGLCESTTELAADFHRANGRIAIDTETDCQGFDLNPITDPPFMLSYSVAPGHGRAIYANNAPLLAAFADLNRQYRPEVVLHNALFDHPVLTRMGVELDWPRIHDTMEDAYLTAGRLPQGLKALAYRHLGLRMSDYMDLVAPACRPHQIAYLYRLARAKTIPQPYLGKRQWKISRKAQMALDAAIDDERVDPQARYHNWYKDEERDIWAAEDALGQFPYRSIRYADQDKAVYYACQDADATRRLRPVIARELGSVRRRTGA